MKRALAIAAMLATLVPDATEAAAATPTPSHRVTASGEYLYCACNFFVDRKDPVLLRPSDHG